MTKEQLREELLEKFPALLEVQLHGFGIEVDELFEFFFYKLASEKELVREEERMILIQALALTRKDIGKNDRHFSEVYLMALEHLEDYLKLLHPQEQEDKTTKQ